MIRIRKTDGTVIPVPDEGCFVELCTPTGEIGMVVFHVPGSIIQVNPGSADALRYENTFRSCGVKFNKILLNRKT